MSKVELNPKMIEDIAREFCSLEGLDPDAEVRVVVHQKVPNDTYEIQPGVTVASAVFNIPQYKDVPYWETLIPEIERMYKMHMAVEKVQAIHLRLFGDRK